MRETGFGYLNSVDNFEQQLDQISYEEADMLLDRMKKEGRVTDDNYWSLQARIRIY